MLQSPLSNFDSCIAAKLSVPRVNDLAVNPFQAESEKWPKTEGHTLLVGAFLLYDTTLEQTIHVTLSMHLPFLESQHLHLGQQYRCPGPCISRSRSAAFHASAESCPSISARTA
jgi:hypothetical protein